MLQSVGSQRVRQDLAAEQQIATHLLECQLQESRDLVCCWAFCLLNYSVSVC